MSSPLQESTNSKKPPVRKKTVPGIVASREKLTMLTAYDYWTAQLVDRAGTDMILVGDSLGMVVQGKEDTLEVTVDEMVYHCRAVNRGRQQALVVGDMPYLSYHISREETVRNAGRIITEGRADAVKLEGGRKRIPMIEAILDAEIPVMGHIGLTPQSVNALGGFKVQGKDFKSWQRAVDDALALQDAGVFALVLECIPYDLAEEITGKLDIPTIGIGAGPACSGQVLVTHDLLGMSFGRTPKFVRQFADLSATGGDGLAAFIEAVHDGAFPTLKESFKPSKKADNIQLYGGDLSLTAKVG
ncbi:3-methyl-2-oxobutanoate hydroxymethyltransferase [Acanthopleuribacter pedis]|uniref:3-methyl-2-oxobutanoate hydroxymethyltransferase n=1 Tax=Acanthopleuribacter pedis TaxID=442870 RepID=A0A8J7QBG4_9BACT|nr:3-methyl-2-oxobutanoate hydroxymethyltransferase [Acanthopleuribacter pedis]MBO1323062.1 3-methyl-2-oxobutanoate hydroxymethyltransferase [Acanthopleuribacter pedis]